MFRYSLIGLPAALALAGCASTGEAIAEDPSIVIADLSTLPIPTTSGYSRSGRAELVRPLDVLSVFVFGVEELSREEIRVGHGGYFDFPLIGAVQANGRSLAEIAHEMETRLSDDYIRNPDVQLDFVAREGQVFTIGGEVEQPGQYPILQPTTLLEAVAIGRGRSEYADLREVMVFREVDEQRYIGVYDLAAIRRGNYPDPEIYPHDTIVVGETGWTRRFARLAPLVPLISSPLILLERVLR